MRKTLLYIPIFLLLASCNFPLSQATADPFEIATQMALTGVPTYVQSTPVSSDEVSTLIPTLAPSPSSTPNPAIPTGKIAYVCQIYKVKSGDQICIMNADGSNQRRLTTEDYTRHFYPSMAPDGKSVIYAQFGGENIYDIYEMTLDGQVFQRTKGMGILTAPEISPDGSKIAFTHGAPLEGHAIWIMNRDGSNPRSVYEFGWDPTWSPDGNEILFASDVGGTVQMYIISAEGGSPRQVNEMDYLRGRTDWSVRGEIVTYSGKSWHRELYLMNDDGSNTHQITPSGGNSQGAGFSPDGNWVIFTAYFDHYDDIHGCEIYIMRTDGTDLRRLTDNDYCDWQPRWGP